MTPAQTNWQLALARFGLGARFGDGGRAGSPKEALLAELVEPRGAKIADAELRSTPQVLQDIYAYDVRRKTERDFAAMAALTRSAMPTPEFAALAFPVAAPATATAPEMASMSSMPAAAAMQPETPPQQKAFRADAQARLAQAYAAPTGFVERLVAFWSNHFCVSVAKSEIGRGAAGAFEREAIRPHVLGRFADMLLAVERHPAMLNFLDNQQSIGPNSLAGHNNKSGLNENLAREILELHTMGVGSGYTQTDVTQLAYILTGWTIVGRDGKLGEPGTFVFNANAHEPTAATLLDRIYVQDGVAQGEAALADIARERATSNHIAFKFARHFVADAPDAGLVQRLAEVFRQTDGDLAALARTLVNDAAAWSAPPTKIRNPWELTVAAYRAFAHTPGDPGPALNALNLLGMPLWQPGGPNGFSDESTAWSSPEGMKTRLQLAAQFAHQIKDAPPPLELVDDILGPNASAATRETVTRAESREQAYALLLLSPEFQRR
jgi:uncharacterized protein (DUF1800 family)